MQQEHRFSGVHPPAAGVLSAVAAVLAAAALLLGGCAVSRHDQVRAQSRTIEHRLRAEQAVALALPAVSTDRAGKLDHLGGLRLTLSAANIALGAVPRAVPEPQRPLAYDILEEVYSTIDWNIPLLPGEGGLRALPAGFQGGVLDLDAALRGRGVNGPGVDATATPGVPIIPMLPGPSTRRGTQE